MLIIMRELTLNRPNEAKMTAGSNVFLVDVYVTKEMQADNTGSENATA
jgi:hypothetical protein